MQLQGILQQLQVAAAVAQGTGEESVGALAAGDPLGPLTPFLAWLVLPYKEAKHDYKGAI